ncbi:MAG: hypothetical protein OEZ36_10230 [Spirochaetota bacterium]|nr:hypothetical protein [Spirochaetota bacterium]
MGANFELSKYDVGQYQVFRLESSEDQLTNPEQMGFAIIELKHDKVKCSRCKQSTSVIQTWWHNKLPYSYVSGKEKGLNVHLCLECATEENNKNIILIKNDNDEEGQENRQKLLLQYEIENEQIEYFKLYKSEEAKLVTH